MTEKEIKKQIEKKKKELEVLEKQLKKELDKTEWIYIPELKIEIQKSIHHKNESYNDLVEGFGVEYLEEHLPTYVQLQFLRNSDKYREFLGLDDTWEFIKQEDEISKRNNYVARFDAYSDRADLYCWVPDVSDASLGVRFVRKKLKGTSNDT